MRLGNIKADGTFIPQYSASEYWHQDGEFRPFPTNFLVNWLLSEIEPEEGGETAFLDLSGGLPKLPVKD